MHSQDTAELFFSEARVPRENLLGEPGKGFLYLVHNLARERISIAIAGVTAARGSDRLGRSRTSASGARFGKSIGGFQAVRHSCSRSAHTEVPRSPARSSTAASTS